MINQTSVNVTQMKSHNLVSFGCGCLNNTILTNHYIYRDNLFIRNKKTFLLTIYVLDYERLTNITEITEISYKQNLIRKLKSIAFS